MKNAVVFEETVDSFEVIMSDKVFQICPMKLCTDRTRKVVMIL